MWVWFESVLRLVAQSAPLASFRVTCALSPLSVSGLDVSMCVRVPVGFSGMRNIPLSSFLRQELIFDIIYLVYFRPFGICDWNSIFHLTVWMKKQTGWVNLSIWPSVTFPTLATNIHAPIMFMHLPGVFDWSGEGLGIQEGWWWCQKNGHISSLLFCAFFICKENFHVCQDCIFVPPPLFISALSKRTVTVKNTEEKGPWTYC